MKKKKNKEKKLFKVSIKKIKGKRQILIDLDFLLKKNNGHTYLYA